MKKRILKSLINTSLIFTLLAQKTLIFLLIFHNGIPVPQKFILDKIPGGLNVDSEEILFYLPFNFKINKASVSAKNIDNLSIFIPCVDISFNPSFLKGSKWTIESNNGTLRIDSYDKKWHISKLESEVKSNIFNKLKLNLREDDKIFILEFSGQQGISESPAFNELNAILTSRDIQSITSSIGNSKNTYISIFLETNEFNKFNIWGKMKSENFKFRELKLNEIDLHTNYFNSNLNFLFNSTKIENSSKNLIAQNITFKMEYSESKELPELNLSSGYIKYEDKIIDNAIFRSLINTKAEGNLKRFRSLDGFIFSGENNVRLSSKSSSNNGTKLFEIDAEIDLSKPLLYSYDLNVIESTNPINVIGKLGLDDSFNLVFFDGTFSCFDLIAFKQNIDYIDSKIFISNDNILANSELRVEDKNLSVETNYHFKSKDYTLAFKGDLFPYDFIKDYCIWPSNNFKKLLLHKNSYVNSNIIIRGNKNELFPKLYLGKIDASNIAFNTILFTEVSLFFEGQGNCVDIDFNKANMTRGNLNGTLKTSFNQNNAKEIESLRCDLRCALTINNTKLLFGDKVYAALSPFKSNNIHKFYIESVSFNRKLKKYFDKSYFNVKINDDKKFTFYGRPIDSLSASIYGRNSNCFIRSGFSKFADGLASYNFDIIADLKNPKQIDLELNLMQSDYDLTMNYLFPSDINKIGKHKDRALRLDLKIKSQGEFNNLLNHEGYGEILISGDKISEINLLGPFTNALNELNISIGTLKINNLKSLFEIDGKRVFIPKIELNGKQSYVFGEGRILIPENSINFSIQIDPIKNSALSISSFGKLGQWINPFPKILNFKVTGTIENQKWRSRFDPRNLF